jgi:hypothetical protein
VSSLNTDNVLLVVGIVIALVVVVNGGLILLMMRGREDNRYRTFFEGIRRMTNPWEEQEAQLKELEERVSRLQNRESEDHPNGV